MANRLTASIFALCVAAVSSVLTTNAEAAFVLRKILPDLPSAASQMQEGSVMMAPIAYVRFCLNNSTQCGKPAEHGRIELTVENWTTIKAVNAEVNDRIAPDASKGAFDWSITTTYGNCNDYAVQKRKELIDKGFSASALSLSVVITPWGEGHLVLTLRTDRGDFVLDNLRHTIVAWDHTGYSFNRVQSIDDPENWVRLGRSDRPEHHRQAPTRKGDEEEIWNNPAYADL